MSSLVFLSQYYICNLPKQYNQVKKCVQLYRDSVSLNVRQVVTRIFGQENPLNKLNCNILQ